MSRYKFGITQWGMPGDGHYPVRIAKEAGLDGVQVDVGFYENGYPLAQQYVRDMYMEDAAKYGIAFPSLALNDLGIHEFVNGRDTEHGKIAYETMQLGIETAAAMKIDTVMVPNFFANFITEERHFDHAVEALVFACDTAAKYGVTIASETILSPEEQFRLLDAVNRPNIAVFFDSMNYKFFSKFDPLEVLKKLYPRMVPQLHIKDGVDVLSGGMLGEGNMDFFKQAEFLAASDFDGWIILENYHSHLPIRGNSRANQLELLKKDLQTAKRALRAS